MLSIRTQDRMTLVPYNRPIQTISYLTNLQLGRKYELRMENVILGKYATKERTLQVMDEISRILTTPNKSADEDENMVYRMPLE